MNSSEGIAPREGQNTNPENKNFDIENKKLEERIMACEKLLPVGKDFENLLVGISGYKTDENRDIRGWNSPINYTEITRVLLPYATKNKHDDFLSIVKRYETDIAGGTPQAQAIQNLCKNMRDGKVCEDVTIAEIGGTFTKDLFEKLGASVDTADAGVEVLHNGQPMQENIITKENLRKFFPGEYDIVCTNNLLTEGSGIEKVAEYGGIQPEDFLICEYQLVKDNGEIINQAESIHRDEELRFFFNHLLEALSRLRDYAKKHPKKVRLKLNCDFFDPLEPLSDNDVKIVVEKDF